jgi:hypothetical protein
MLPSDLGQLYHREVGRDRSQYMVRFRIFESSGPVFHHGKNYRYAYNYDRGRVAQV